MVEITYVEANGTTHAVEVEVGSSVMEGAKRNGIEGIVAECGGNCACGTCRVYVDEHWWRKTGGPSDLEDATMDMRDDPATNKRLSCQIGVTQELDGLVVRMPSSQF